MAENTALLLKAWLRRQKLQAIADEATLHRLLHDLLPRLGYDWAEVTHGPNEQGKDLVARGSSRTGGDEYLAVVAKLGGISAASNDRSNLNNVIQQVRTAFLVPYEGHRVHARVFITKVLVVCTGNISEQAQTQIRAQSGELRAVDFWSLDGLEEHVTSHLPGFYFDIEPHIHDYLVRLRDKCVDITEDHRRLGSHVSRLLPEVFVEPTILPLDEISLATRGRRAPKLGKTRLVFPDPKISTFDTSYLEYPSKSIVVMGEPGSGKTFAIQRAALRLVERRLAGDSDAPLPLLARASAFADALESPAEQDLTRAVFACDALSASELHEELVQRASVLFVDALDEIASSNSRDTVLEKLQTLEATFPSLRIVCTMRVMRLWRPNEVRSFQQALVLPMNNRAIAKLLENILGRGEKYTQVLRALSETGLHRSLPKTPLVVTILAILHEQQKMDEIPSTIADLYDMFLQVYLGRWSTDRDSAAHGPSMYRLRLAVLQEIAYFLHDHHLVAAPFVDLAGLAHRYLSERGWPEDGGKLLIDIANRTGLLTFQDRDGMRTELEADSSEAQREGVFLSSSTTLSRSTWSRRVWHSLGMILSRPSRGFLILGGATL